MLEATHKNVKVFYEDTVQDWTRQTTQKAMIEELKQYPQEKVIHFIEKRMLTVETEIIKDIMEAEKLMGVIGKADNFLTKAEQIFDLSDPYIFRGKKKGDKIENGYMQIMNFLYTIRFHPEQELIIGIEFPENKLHELVRIQLIKALVSMPKIKQLYFTTRSEKMYDFVKKCSIPI